MTRRLVSRGAVLVSLGLAAFAGAEPVAGPDVTAFVAPYLRARDERAVGEVLGRTLGDPARPTAPPVPYEGVSVMLLPQSPDFESEVAAIKAHLRDSLKTYMGAPAEVTEARTAYERALLGVGGGELIRGEVSDAQGQIRLAEVPAGAWLLLAWREVPHPAKPPKLRPGDASAFREIPVSAGYSTVTYWFRPLEVRAGETTSVDLNDRNVWLTGIREEIRVIEGTPKKKSSTGTNKRH
jgi:hypothetical protein